MNRRRPPAIIPRREKERDLFFFGEWSNTDLALIIPVAKPSYRPDFGRAEAEDISGVLEELLGKGVILHCRSPASYPATVFMSVLRIELWFS